ncbi:MAG: hypothetical protein WAZ34_05960 [Rhodocyclaceae bacterium]
MPPGGCETHFARCSSAWAACQDLDCSDLILAMDKSNLDNLQRMASREAQARIKLDYSANFEDASQGLVGEIKKTIGGKPRS